MQRSPRSPRRRRIAIGAIAALALAGGAVAAVLLAESEDGGSGEPTPTVTAVETAPRGDEALNQARGLVRWLENNTRQ